MKDTNDEQPADRLDKLVAFAKYVISESWRSCDVDGSDIHDKALDLGLVKHGGLDCDGDPICLFTEIITGRKG